METSKESPGNPFLFKELPELKLSINTDIEGYVVYISSDGLVWFCLKSIQPSLDMLTRKLDCLDRERKLKRANILKEGMVCIARSSQDGELYRARLDSLGQSLKCASVSFIDFGDDDTVDAQHLYQMPCGLEMLAPASTGIVLDTNTPKKNIKCALENLLIEVFDCFILN